jgi:hypothetical protein
LARFTLTSYIMNSINIIKSEGQSPKEGSGAIFSRRTNKVTKHKVNEGGFDIEVEHIIDYDMNVGVCDFRTCMAMFV